MSQNIKEAHLAPPPPRNITKQRPGCKLKPHGGAQRNGRRTRQPRSPTVTGCATNFRKAAGDRPPLDSQIHTLFISNGCWAAWHCFQCAFSTQKPGLTTPNPAHVAGLTSKKRRLFALIPAASTAATPQIQGPTPVPPPPGRKSLERGRGSPLPTALTLPQRHSHTPTPAPTAFPTARNRLPQPLSHPL